MTKFGVGLKFYIWLARRPSWKSSYYYKRIKSSYWHILFFLLHSISLVVVSILNLVEGHQQMMLHKNSNCSSLILVLKQYFGMINCVKTKQIQYQVRTELSLWLVKWFDNITLNVVHVLFIMLATSLWHTFVYYIEQLFRFCELSAHNILFFNKLYYIKQQLL